MDLLGIVIAIIIFGIALATIIVALNATTKTIIDNNNETTLRLLASNNIAKATEITRTPLTSSGWVLNRNGEFYPSHAEGVYASLLEFRMGSQQFSYIVLTKEDPVGNSFLNLRVQDISGLTKGSNVIDLYGNTGLVNVNGQVVPGVSFVGDSTIAALPTILLVEPVRSIP